MPEDWHWIQGCVSCAESATNLVTKNSLCIVVGGRTMLKKIDQLIAFAPVDR